MTLTGGYHRLTKDQEGSSIDITCIKIAKINVSRNFKTAGLAYWSLYALSGLMSRTVEGVHGKTRHFCDREDFFCSIDEE